MVTQESLAQPDNLTNYDLLVALTGWGFDFSNASKENQEKDNSIQSLYVAGEQTRAEKGVQAIYDQQQLQEQKIEAVLNIALVILAIIIIALIISKFW